MHHAENFIITDKRQRTATFSRARRNVDKVMIVVSHQGQNATQVTTTILTSTFPSTVTGIRWDLTFDQEAGTGASEMDWAIVLVKEGQGPDTMQSANAAIFYEPEQNCLVFGHSTVRNQLQTNHETGTTKTMRKMMVGDRIVFIFAGTATNTSSVHGIIQLFQKM